MLRFIKRIISYRVDKGKSLDLTEKIAILWLYNHKSRRRWPCMANKFFITFSTIEDLVEVLEFLDENYLWHGEPDLNSISVTVGTENRSYLERFLTEINGWSIQVQPPQ